MITTRLKREIATAGKDGATLILVSLAMALLFLKTADLKSSKSISASPPEGMQPPAQSIKTIGFSELKEMITTGKKELVIVDTRDTFFFQMGHIPNAISIPMKAFNLDYTTYQTQLPQTNTIVVYCARESCTDSEKMALKLISLGYKNILVYKGGYDEWEMALKGITQ